MKGKKGLAYSLIAIMVIICIILVIAMMAGGKKETYYGVMKNGTTIDKMISEKRRKKSKRTLNFHQMLMYLLKKEDFVRITKNEKSGKIASVKKVDHDDVPHGLMTQIHDMGDMHM
ncbi:DUF4889 domain-containing protein [Staphylococcus pasteuri]